MAAAVMTVVLISGAYGDQALADAQFSLGMKLFGQGSYRGAALELQRLLGFDSWSYSRALRSDARLLEALSWYRNGNTAMAISRFRELKSDLRLRPVLRAAAEYYFAACLDRLKRADNALYYYMAVARKYPVHPLADDARYAIARLWFEAGDSSRADRELQRLLADYPNGSHAEAARMLRRVIAGPASSVSTVTGRPAGTNIQTVYRTVTNYITNYIVTPASNTAPPADYTALQQKLQQQLQDLQKQKDDAGKRKQQFDQEMQRLKSLELLLKVKEKNLEAYLKMLQIREAALNKKEKELRSLEQK